MFLRTFESVIAGYATTYRFFFLLENVKGLTRRPNPNATEDNAHEQLIEAHYIVKR